MSTNTYTTLASLPAASSNTGNIALVTSNGVQYISDGQKWKSQGEFTTGTIESLQLDDLSFNGSFTNFALKVGGSNVFPQNTTDVIIVVNGNTLKPGRDFTFIKTATATNISFTNSDNTPKAYPAGTIFYGLVFSRLPLDSNNALQKSGGTMVGDITFSSNQSFPSSGIDNASTTQSGIVSLSSSTGSTSESVAATSKAVKDTKDAADAAASTANSALPKAGGTMTGDITFNSTQEFDGRDLSVDGTKLDGIATSANNYSISSDLLDEDNMASDSATKVASQQSIKAYVDANTGTTNLSYTASSRELASSTGTNVTLPEATTSAAGLQSSADKTKLDGIETAATADQTGAEIKSAYEGEADTNAFTDADHTKLDGIATGAEVNVNADWNSTSGDSQILNKPTLVSALNDLSDVSASSPSANQIIKWNGSAWALAADGGGSGGGGVSQNLIVTLTESIDGSRTDFTMSTTPATAQNLMVSINGVIQKPNAGTTISNSSEGYCVSGSTLKFATAPANGSTVFVVAQTAGSGGSTDLSFNDSAKVKLGTGNDLEIYHDGSNSFISDSGTGILNISSNLLQIINAAGNEVLGAFNENGSVDLYYDNSKKFETTSYGVRFVDLIKLDNPTTAGRDVTWNHAGDELRFEDNTKASFGLGSDLQIYHDGTNNIINTKTGSLLHQYNGTTVALQTDTRLGFQDNKKASFGTGNDLEIYHDGNHSRIDEVGSGSLLLQTNGTSIQLNKGTSENMLVAYTDGNVKLYHDNSQKFRTYAAGVEVTGNVTIPFDGTSTTNALRIGASQDLTIYHDGSHNRIQNAVANQNIYIEGYPNEPSTPFIYLNPRRDVTGLSVKANQGVDLYYDGVKKLETHASNGVVFPAGLQAPDSQALRLGSSNDFLIYHNGSNNFVRGSHRTIFNSNASTTSYAGFDPIDSGTLALVIRKAVNSEFFPCWFSNTNGNQGEIRVNAGGGTSYVGSSDYRLKENISTITDGITRVKQLIPRRFNWKNDDTKKLWDGFIAHEVSPAVPSAVTGEKDAPIDADGNGYQGMEKAQLIPVLTAALKEAIAKIETLETKVAALEGA